MLISIRDDRGRRLAAVTVVAAHPPSVLHVDSAGGLCTSAGASTKELFLNWDRALDDKGNLRKCPVCECEEFFARKQFRQVTALVLLVLAGVLAIVFLGLRALAASVIVLVLVAALDAAMLLFARWRLVCYGCGSEFSNLPIDPHHPRWNMALAEKYRSRHNGPTKPGDAPTQARKGS